MANLFKTKKKEVSSGTIKGIDHLDGHYKKFDDSIAPDDKAANPEDNFTVVDKEHFVTFSVSDNDPCSPERPNHGLLKTSAPDTVTAHTQQRVRHKQTEITNSTSQIPSVTACNSSNEGELILCKHCKTKLTRDEQQMLKNISTRCENDGEQSQDNWVRSDRGNVEHKEVQTDEIKE